MTRAGSRIGSTARGVVFYAALATLGDIGLATADDAVSVTRTDAGPATKEDAGSAAVDDAGRHDADDAPFEDGGYLEFGAMSGVHGSMLTQIDSDARQTPFFAAFLYVAGAWRHGAFFVDGQRGGLDGYNLGATLWNDETRSLDLLAAHVPGSARGLSDEADDLDSPTEQDRRNSDLLNRNDLFGSSGFRFREYRGDTLLQASAVMDWEHGNGVLLGAHAGRQWQLGNWNLQGIAGLRWASAELVDYVFGVDEDEATEHFPAYRADDSLFVEVALDAVYPLGRDWIMHSSLHASWFDSGVTDSPLVAAGDSAGLTFGFAYVF